MVAIEMKDKRVNAVELKFAKECNKLYGAKIFIGSGYGFIDDGCTGTIGTFILAQSNDEAILANLPNEVEGFPVKKSSIAIPY